MRGTVVTLWGLMTLWGTVVTVIKRSLVIVEKKEFIPLIPDLVSLLNTVTIVHELCNLFKQVEDLFI